MVSWDQFWCGFSNSVTTNSVIYVLLLYFCGVIYARLHNVKAYRFLRTLGLKKFRMDVPGCPSDFFQSRSYADLQLHVHILHVHFMYINKYCTRITYVCSLTIRRNWDEFLNFYAFRSEIDSQKTNWTMRKKLRRKRKVQNWAIFARNVCHSFIQNLP